MPETIERYTIHNDNGLSLEALNYGAIITKLLWNTESQDPSNLVLHFDHVDDYIDNQFYLGGIVGRFANRIKNGKVSIDGTECQLSLNEGDKHLHGGVNSFTRKFWKVEKVAKNKLTFHYFSPHMEEGYPGNLDVTMSYTLTAENELLIEYSATTDKKTIINLTNHAYFNLSGNDGLGLDHHLQVFSNCIVEPDEDQLPTGNINDITGTAFDFQKPASIRDKMDASENSIEYDHCYVFKENILEKMAVLSHPGSKIKMEVFSTEPGIQVYTGNHLQGPFKKHAGVCLETQHFPDSPNHPQFHSTFLGAGETFESKTIYKFSKLEE